MSNLIIKNTKKLGRGVFAAKNIPANVLIESAPILLMPYIEVPNCSILDLYCYGWNDENIAIALGYGGLYNHNFKPNVFYQNNFEKNVIEFYTIKKIRKGQQLFIDYGYNPIYAKKRYMKNRLCKKLFS